MQLCRYKMEEGCEGKCAFEALEVKVPLSSKGSVMVILSRAKSKGHHPDMGFGQSKAWKSVTFQGQGEVMGGLPQ